MAIERQSQPLNFQSPQQAAIQQSTMGNVSPDVNKFFDGNSIQQSAPDAHSQLLGSILDTITGASKDVAKTAMATSQEEAYLRGSAAAGLGQAQADIQSNPLTANWANAGYADTVGRLKAADAEAQTQVDMNKLSQGSPEDFQNYLATRRDQLMPNLDGMSMDARKSFLAQQLVSERAATKLYQTAHQKFIVDQVSSSVQADVSAKFDALDDPKVKADADTYQWATANAFTSIYGNVWNNPQLPKDVRQKLTVEAMQSALGRNHLQLFDAFRNQKIDMVGSNGKTTNDTMFNQLDFNDQTKLVQAQDTALKNTAAVRNADWNTQTELFLSAMKDPNQPLVSYSDMQAYVNNGLATGVLDEGGTKRIVSAWADANQQKAQSGDLALAWQSGDGQKMMDLGNKSDDDGYNAWIHQQSVAKRPVEQVVGDALSLVKSTGSLAAARGVASLTKSAVTQLGLTDQASPANAKMLSTVLGQLDDAESQGKSGAMSAYLSQFSDDDRNKITAFRESLQDGKDPQTAAAIAQQAQVDNAKISPQLRNVLAGNKAKDTASFINSFEPRGLWGTISGKVASWFSGESSDKWKVGAGKMWFENPERADAALAGTKSAIAEELGYIDRSNPSASQDSRQQLALAAVAGRTIVTDSGPLVLPHMTKGQSVQSFFGVPASTTPSAIGDVLSQQFRPQNPDNRVAWRSNTDGTLRYDEYGKSGQFVTGGTFDPKSVAPMVAQRQQAISDKFQATDGPGLTKGSGDNKVTYNGATTAQGVNTDMMLNFRNNLVAHEGVVNTPAPDLSGKQVNGNPVMTSGVGVSSHNPNYEAPQGPNGTHTPDQINRMFMKASDQAANQGQRIIQANNIGFKAFPLVSELAYQGLGNTSPLFAAMKAKDKPAALTALKQTTAYGMSQPTRQAAYEAMLNKSME